MNTIEKIDVAILCPIRLEFDTVRKHLKNTISVEDENYGFSFDVGSIQCENRAWRVALIETGPKVGNMQVKTNNVILALRPKFIFLVGIAAGFKDARIGDVVVGEKAYGYESGKETKDGFKPRVDSDRPSPKLFSLACRLARDFDRKNNTHKLIIGPIASGDKLLATHDSHTVQLIHKHYENTQAVEMEAIGFYKAATQFLEDGVQFLIIRGISDLMNEKEKTDTDGSREIAAARAVEFLLYILEHLPSSKNKKKEIPFSMMVFFLAQPYPNWLRLKKREKAKLVFYKNEIGLILPEEEQEVIKLNTVERYTMPGDFAPNWVKVTFVKKGNREAIFFSENKAFGLGSILGSSKRMYQYLKPYAIS